MLYMPKHYLSLVGHEFPERITHAAVRVSGHRVVVAAASLRPARSVLHVHDVKDFEFRFWTQCSACRFYLDVLHITFISTSMVQNFRNIYFFVLVNHELTFSSEWVRQEVHLYGLPATMTNSMAFKQVQLKKIHGRSLQATEGAPIATAGRLSALIRLDSISTCS